MYILVHSCAIPVHSCPFQFHSSSIPADSCPFLWIPVDSSGMGSFLQESVRHGEVLEEDSEESEVVEYKAPASVPNPDDA